MKVKHAIKELLKHDPELDIVNDLAGYTDKSVAEHVSDGGF